MEDFWTSFQERFIYSIWKKEYKTLEFVEKLSVEPAAVQKWMDGVTQPRKRYFKEISETLEVNPEWLFDGHCS